MNLIVAIQRIFRRRSPESGIILATAASERVPYLGRRIFMTLRSVRYRLSQRGHAHHGKGARLTRPNVDVDEVSTLVGKWEVEPFWKYEG